jgi:hypothetical protein
MIFRDGYDSQPSLKMPLCLEADGSKAISRNRFLEAGGSIVKFITFSNKVR